MHVAACYMHVEDMYMHPMTCYQSRLCVWVRISIPSLPSLQLRG